MALSNATKSACHLLFSTTLEKIPCVMELRLLRSLPCSVRGPVDLRRRTGLDFFFLCDSNSIGFSSPAPQSSPAANVDPLMGMPFISTFVRSTACLSIYVHNTMRQYIPRRVAQRIRL